MNRLALRGILSVVGLCIFFAVRYTNRGHAGDDARKVAHRIVAKVDGYSASKDYIDYLVDDAHDHVFNESYHMDYGRHQDRSWLDGDKYIEDLFTYMIDAANADNAKGVADALSKYRTEHLRNQGK